MLQVIKRNGEIADFDLNKISGAIEKAFKATNKTYTKDIIGLLALRVTADFQPKITDEKIDVESVQDSAEKVLAGAGFQDVAKAYILYRKQREKLRSMRSTILDYKEVVNSYVMVEDWRIPEEKTPSFSLGGLILSNSGAVTENYWLSEIFDQEISNAHRQGEIYIHDLNMLAGRHSGWSLQRLIREGICKIPGKVSCGPAKYLSVLCSQMVDFLAILQNEWAGSQTFASFDTLLAPFIKREGLNDSEIRQCMENFVFGINMPSRWGTQAPESVITLDFTVPEDMKKEAAFAGGRLQNFTYGDCQEEMNRLNKALLETLLAGDSSGDRFAYPVVICNMTDDYDWDHEELNRLLFTITAKYGTPVFANGRSDRAQATRTIRSIRDMDRIRPAGNTLHTGSIGCVTINLPRIGYEASDEADFYRRLDRVLDIAARALKIRRGVLMRLNSEGLYPYTAHYAEGFDQYYSTISLLGMNEAVQNASWLKDSLGNARCYKFALAVMEHICGRLDDYQEKYQDLYDLDGREYRQVSGMLAAEDRRRFPEILTAAGPGEKPCYSTATMLQSGFTSQVEEALDLQDSLQIFYSAGCSFDIPIPEEMSSYRTAMELIRSLLAGHDVPYIRLIPTYSVCREHGYLSGSLDECPLCGRKTALYNLSDHYFVIAESEIGQRGRKAVAPGMFPRIRKAVTSAERSGQYVQRAQEQNFEPVGEPRKALSFDELYSAGKIALKGSAQEDDPLQEESHLLKKRSPKEELLDLDQEDSFAAGAYREVKADESIWSADFRDTAEITSIEDMGSATVEYNVEIPDPVGTGGEAESFDPTDAEGQTEIPDPVGTEGETEIADPEDIEDEAERSDLEDIEGEAESSDPADAESEAGMKETADRYGEMESAGFRNHTDDTDNTAQAETADDASQSKAADFYDKAETADSRNDAETAGENNEMNNAAESAEMKTADFQNSAETAGDNKEIKTTAADPAAAKADPEETEDPEEAADPERRENLEETADPEETAEQAETGSDGNYLFITRTSTNSMIARQDMDRAGIPYQLIEAKQEPELVRRMEIIYAPTLAVIKDGLIERYCGANNIRAYIKSQTDQDKV